MRVRNRPDDNSAGCYSHQASMNEWEPECCARPGVPILKRPGVSRANRSTSDTALTRYMAFEFNPLALPLLAAAAMNLVFVRYAWTRRQSPRALALVVFMVALVALAIDGVLIIAGIDLATKMLWWRLEYFPIAAGLVAWTLRIGQYAGWIEVLRPKIVGLLLLEPIFTGALLLTNDLADEIAPSRLASFHLALLRTWL